MANQSWVSLINAGSSRATGAGTALNTAATATISPCQAAALTSDVASVNPDGQPLGWYPGLVIRCMARGYMTTTGTSTTATWLLRCNKGNNNTYTTFATTVGLTTGTGSVTGLQWHMDATLRCTAVGSGTSGSVSTQAWLEISSSVPANPVALGSAGNTVLPMPNITGETALGIDTTQVTGIGLAATLAGANATIQCTEWIVEALD
jgi:hypothetical protein